MEIGLDILNIDFNTSASGEVFPKNDIDFSRPLSPVIVANIQKLFYGTEKFRLTLGAQIGYSHQKHEKSKK